MVENSNNYGIGSPAPVKNSSSQFDSSRTLIWADDTTGTGSLSADEIISHITAGLSASQLGAVVKVSSVSDFAEYCSPGFSGISSCWAGVAFNALPALNESTPANYTIEADEGLGYINVRDHSSDFQTIIMPLQWALDQAIIELRTGATPPTPLEWAYMQETNRQQSDDNRTRYVRAIRNFIVIILFILFIPITHHLPGWFASERSEFFD